MKKIFQLIVVMAPLVVTTVAGAVWYPFPNRESAPVRKEAGLGVGSRVFMFHNPPDCARHEIKVDDILTVYRGYPPDAAAGSREVGKVKVIALNGEYYVRGEVVAGNMLPGDLARKGTAVCLVTSQEKGRP
ncbi:hypothetical protein [Geomesophilobacter sediminis]|uniref:Uncharacterized protein n=1 Tax=Geomesophilobacter sediminis TaxID=2798584 RepID=A0A8J7LY75_9BACT|nr:hypothetical protein [Geomesophilobacter sediminis]MBJ6724486.1 hypothetical protein [Geomesophilobacter sediminis]